MYLPLNVAAICTSSIQVHRILFLPYKYHCFFRRSHSCSAPVLYQRQACGSTPNLSPALLQIKSSRHAATDINHQTQAAIMAHPSSCAEYLRDKG